MRTQHVVVLYALLVATWSACRTVVEEVPAEPVAGSSAPEERAPIAATMRNAQVESTAAPDASGYGWTELRGRKIGTGESNASELRKSLGLSVIEDAGYMTMRAFALRSSPTSDYVTVLVEVTNSGVPLRCFIKAEQIKLLTSSGELIPVQRDSAFVSGSLAQSDIVTDTCLASGETGYFNTSPMSSITNAFAALEQLEFTLSMSNSEYERPDFKLVPKRYTVDDDRIQIELVNEGIAKAPIDELLLVQYILLDAEGLPIDMAYLEATTTGLSVPAGGTLTADDTYYFSGASERMKVLAAY